MRLTGAPEGIFGNQLVVRIRTSEEEGRGSSLQRDREVLSTPNDNIQIHNQYKCCSIVFDLKIKIMVNKLDLFLY